MKKIVLIILLVAITVSSTMNFAGDNKNGLKEKSDKIASAMISDYGVTSVQYALIDNGEIILSESKGVYAKDSNKPITKDTMYGIASLSKMYVSAATMMLVDWGKVDIDKPLTTYITDFKMADERYKKITPRMLLNHSSGLYGSHYYNGSLFEDNDLTVKNNLLLNLQTEKLNSNPGEFSAYCNDGFQLLEILVERMSGMSYTAFLDKYISQPLNLKNTKTPIDNFDREKLAKLYNPMIEKELPTLNTNLLGAGGVYSTAEEVCKFSEVLMGKKENVLSQKSALEMQNEEYKRGIWVSDDENITGYGLGWDTVKLWPFSKYNIKALYKGGDANYRSSLVVIPEHNIAMAVISSEGSSIFNQIFASNILLEVLKDKGIIKEIKSNETFTPPVKLDMPKELLKYSGVYGVGSIFGWTYEIEMKDNGFIIPEAFDGMIPAQKYIYVGNMEFKNEDGTAIATFKEEKNGKTYLQVKEYMNFKGIGQTIMTSFQSVKLHAKSVDKDVLNVWKQRDGKRYLAVGEKASSSMYLEPMLMINKLIIDTKNGYTKACEIIDKNNAVNAVQIPGDLGRDGTDLKFYKENGIEYLKTIDMTFINEDYVKPLDDKESSTITIEVNGHAKWYKVDKNIENKTMTVKLPNGGAFAIYNENGEYVNLTTVSGVNSCTLPKNGMIVFAGKPNDVFEITLKK